MKNIGWINSFFSKDEWLDALLLNFISLLQKTIIEQDSFILAVSGGTTPFPFYSRVVDKFLTSKELQVLAPKIDVILVDERIVPLTHSESNAGKLLQLWKKIPFNIHCINPVINLESAEEQYQRILQRLNNRFQNDILEIDLLLLGMGDDGHTASLFPNSPALSEVDKWVVMNTHPKIIEKRLTLTFPILSKAQNRWVLIRGDVKRKLLNEIIMNTGVNYPIENLMIDSGVTLKWFIN